MAGIVPCAGFLGDALLSYDTNLSCAWLRPTRQRRGWFGWRWRSLGLSHAVVFIQSWHVAIAGAICRSNIFVIVSCGAKICGSRGGPFYSIRLKNSPWKLNCFNVSWLDLDSTQNTSVWFLKKVFWSERVPFSYFRWLPLAVNAQILGGTPRMSHPKKCTNLGSTQQVNNDT